MNVSDLSRSTSTPTPRFRAGNRLDVMWEPYEEAASKYFKVGKRPTIAETLSLLSRDARSAW